MHCRDLKVLSSQAKIYENFANYLLKTVANNNLIWLNYKSVYRRVVDRNNMRLQTRSSNVALIKPSSQFAVPWAYVKKIIINYQ